MLGVPEDTEVEDRADDKWQVEEITDSKWARCGRGQPSQYMDETEPRLS